MLSFSRAFFQKSEELWNSSQPNVNMSSPQAESAAKPCTNPCRSSAQFETAAKQNVHSLPLLTAGPGVKPIQSNEVLAQPLPAREIETETAVRLISKSESFIHSMRTIQEQGEKDMRRLEELHGVYGQ